MRPCKKTPLFVGILALILILMNHWMDRAFFSHASLQYDEVFHPKVNADVVIFGASQATHGINPRYLESDRIRVYNFALNGANPVFYLNWYRKIFRRCYRKPSYILFGVYWGMFDRTTLTRTLEQDSRYFPLRFFLQESKNFNGLKTLLLTRFPIVTERRQLAERLLKRNQREVYPRAKYYKGFIPFETKRDLTDAVIPQYDRDRIKAFEELLDGFEKDRIRVIFVHVPGYSPGYRSSDITGGVRLIRRISEKRDIPFLDYEIERKSAINMNRDYFSDCFHLNEKGSDAFSTVLAKDIGPLLR